MNAKKKTKRGYARGDGRRSKILNFKVSEQEYKDLTRLAIKSGKGSCSEFIRSFIPYFAKKESAR